MSVFLSDKDFQRLSQVVREETGNHVQEKNHSMLESRLRGHMIKLNIKSIPDYWLHFERHEAEEREALKALMTTHYTFFFREFIHFEVLEKWINRHLGQLNRQYETSKTPLKIWSADRIVGIDLVAETMLKLSLKQAKAA
jgi:chemotaxis protein methyltransferase CheR